MEQVIKDAFDILEKRVLTLDGFDAANYLERKKTIHFIKINYKAPCLRTKLSHKSHLGKLNLSNILVINSDDVGCDKARFNPEKNVIDYVNGDNNLEALVHELIHMATTKDLYNIGYNLGRKSNDTMHYIDFNEGATQWLTVKALVGTDNYNCSYPIETRIARMLAIAVGEELFLECFSKNSIKSLNRNIKLDKVRNPVKKILSLLEYFQTCNYYQTYINQDLKLNYKHFTKETKNLNMEKLTVLNKIQKLIIDIFLSNINNLELDKIKEFKALLINNKTNNRILKTILSPLIKKDTYSLNYFNNKLQKEHNEIYKTLVKTRIIL